MPNFKRRRYWIDSKVQMALVRRLIVHWCAFAVVTCAMTVLFLSLSEPMGPVIPRFRRMWWVVAPFLLTIVLLLPAFVYDSIRLSNRFSGPIFRFRRSMKQLANGEPVEKIHFRNGDFWHDLGDDFNALLDRLAEEKKEMAASASQDAG